MSELKKYLEERLTNVQRLVILGAGSLECADDAAGVLIASRLAEKFNEKEFTKLRIYEGYTAPENYTGEIKRFKPSHLIILDAADLREEPGNVMVIDPEVINGVSFSTHMLPIKVMADYIKKETGCQIIILGIQPIDVTYGAEISPEIMAAVNDVVEIMSTVITASNLK